MDTGNQFGVFALCVFVGFVGGGIYEIFSLFRSVLGCTKGKKKAVGVAIDIVYFFVFAVVCTVFAYAFRFPSFRPYFWLGYLLGGILYLKTLHQIVAFFKKICYNGIRKWMKKAKNAEKTLSEEVNKRI